MIMFNIRCVLLLLLLTSPRMSLAAAVTNDPVITIEVVSSLDGAREKSYFLPPAAPNARVWLNIYPGGHSGNPQAGWVGFRHLLANQGEALDHTPLSK